MRKDLFEKVVDFLTEIEWYRMHHHMSLIKHWYFRERGRRHEVVVKFENGLEKVFSLSEVLRKKVA